MNSEQIKDLAIAALEDLKAIDLTALDVRTLTTIADFMIICTGRSNRHVRSLAESVVKKAKEHHHTYIRTEGENEGEWIIVDLSDVIVHVMQPAAREFYSLEDLWEATHAHSNHRNRQ